MVWTDHKNLTFFQSVKRLNSCQARWALFFTQFHFTITYGPVSRNHKPDVLSFPFSPDHGPSNPFAILPEECVVGMLNWQVEMVVKEARERGRICGCVRSLCSGQGNTKRWRDSYSPCPSPDHPVPTLPWTLSQDFHRPRGTQSF